QQTIVIAKELIKTEHNKQLVRFLGTWINTKFNEKLIKSKARSIVTQATKALIEKKLTVVQLAYLNNIYIIPKLSYLLQTSWLFNQELYYIHQLFAMLFKNKMEILITTGNYIIELNSNSSDNDFALLRLKQGLILANIDRKFWQDRNWDSLKKIWKFNLTCLTFLKAKRLELTFQLLQEPWTLHGVEETFRTNLQRWSKNNNLVTTQIPER
ncbi:21174_t:CDS:2, partial [Gigaspora margarita]